jgi:tetratricopeptide (TPR) repeat protein
MGEPFDVLLCYSSTDRPAVGELEDELRRRGLRVWRDQDGLLPGRPWQEEVEAALKAAPAVAVILGPEGQRPWQKAEIQAALWLAYERGVRVIPVLLPGMADNPDLPPFLNNFTWIDLRNGFEAEPLANLERGIRGETTAQSNPTLPAAEPRALSGKVFHLGPNDEEVAEAGIWVRLEPSGSREKTNAQGRFWFPLPRYLRADDTVTLEVEKPGWRIRYPLNGEVRIPVEPRRHLERVELDRSAMSRLAGALRVSIYLLLAGLMVWWLISSQMRKPGEGSEEIDRILSDLEQVPLEDLATRLGDYRSTERLLEEKLTSIETEGRPDTDNATRISLAISEIANIYDPNRGLLFAERAIKHQPRNPAAWSRRGAALGKLGEAGEAEASYLKAKELCVELKNELCIADQYRNLGLLHDKAGSHARAASEHKNALSIYQSISAAEGIAASRLNLAMAERGLGDFLSARQNVELGMGLALALKNARLIACAELELGNLSFIANDLPDAEMHFLRALGESTTLQDHFRMLSALGNLAAVYMSMGNYDKAHKIFDQSIEIGLATEDYRSVAADTNNKGLTYLRQGKYGLAREMHLKALELALRHRIPDQEAANLGNLGRISRQEEKYNEALDYFRRSLAIYESTGKMEGVAKETSNIAGIEMKLGQFESAIEGFRFAAELDQKLGLLKSEAGNTANLGEALSKAGRKSEAIIALKRSMILFDRLGRKEDRDFVKKYIDDINERGSTFK